MMRSLILHEIDQIGGGFYCISSDRKWVMEIPEIALDYTTFMNVHYPNTNYEFRLQIVIAAARSKCREIFTGGRIKESLDDDDYL